MKIVINDIEYEVVENIHEYIEKYCAYGCKYFILKQVRK